MIGVSVCKLYAATDTHTHTQFYRKLGVRTLYLHDQRVFCFIASTMCTQGIYLIWQENVCFSLLRRLSSRLPVFVGLLGSLMLLPRSCWWWWLGDARAMPVRCCCFCSPLWRLLLLFTADYTLCGFVSVRCIVYILLFDTAGWLRPPGIYSHRHSANIW